MNEIYKIQVYMKFEIELLKFLIRKKRITHNKKEKKHLYFKITQLIDEIF